MPEIIIIVCIVIILFMVIRKLPQISNKKIIPKVEIKQKAAKFKKNISTKKISFGKGDKKEKEKVKKLLSQANLFLEQKQHSKAEGKYIKAIEYDKNNAEAYNGLGVLYLQKEDYNYALKSFSKAIKIDPENASLYNNLGLVLYKQGKNKKAIQVFCRSVDLEKNASRCMNLGLAYWVDGDYKSAISAYQEGLNLEPNNIEYLVTLASAYLKTDQKNQAKKILSKILKLDPENIEAKRELARIK